MSIIKKEKVLIAMSGGVDSSVAAALLVEQGYNVTGAFMINYDMDTLQFGGQAQINADDADNADNADTKTSCWFPDYQDALRVAARLGIPLLKLNFVKEYREMVLEYMYAEYNAGRTPNPDVMCNKFVKFGVWLDAVKKLGFNKLATGHYARLGFVAPGRPENPPLRLRVVSSHSGLSPSGSKTAERGVGGCFTLLQAKDQNKDQTYFLHQLNQDQLARTLFPLGDYTKTEVRELARKFDLPTAEKGESMGICFVGKVSMKDFLKDKVTAKPGTVLTRSGEVIGQHEGLAFYTIGQRHGFTQAGGGKPLFVVEKNFETNELIVGYEDDSALFQEEIRVEQMHWISGQKPAFLLQCEVRLRHRQELQKATAVEENGVLKLHFEQKQRAATPGQFAVLYKDGECLGGGIIKD